MRKSISRLAIIIILLILLFGLFWLYFRQFGKKNNKTYTPNHEDQSNIVNTEKPAPQNNFDYKRNDEATTIPQPESSDPDQTNPYLYYDQSSEEFKRGDYPSALINIEKAITMQPKNPTFYIKKAEILMNMGRKSEAISTIQEALEILPDNPLMLNELEILEAQ